MTYRDIDVNVSSETKSMLLQVQKFSMEVMRPAGIQLDRLSTPEEVIAKGSPLWKVFRGFRELDLHLPPDSQGRRRNGRRPRSIGGSSHSRAARVCRLRPHHQLGVSCLPFNYAALFPIPEMQRLVRDFCADKKGELIGCWGSPNRTTDGLVPRRQQSEMRPFGQSGPEGG